MSSRSWSSRINYFAGSPLNRVSWLRPSHTYLNALIDAPDAKWILFNAGKPLVMTTGTANTSSSTSRSTEAEAEQQQQQQQRQRRPVFLSTQDVKPILGSRPYFGQGKDPGDVLPDSFVESHEHKHEHEHDSRDQHSPTQAARHRGLRVVFLGVLEAATLDSGGSRSSSSSRKPEGTPYFAADVSELASSGDGSQASDELRTFLLVIAHVGQWSDPLSLIGGRTTTTTSKGLLDAFTAALFASAKIMVDWNARNKFCPACGSPTYSLWGGWKIACRSLLPWCAPQNQKTNERQCFTANSLHNFMHPRTDAVVIMIAIDDRVDKVLLGRARKHPENYYSAPAGFIEPGEALEDAVKREMWEETGVRVWNVMYHSGQPWPFPATLMLGFYAQADSTQPIRLDLDNELKDARWFTRQEIESVLLEDHTQGSAAGFRRVADHDHHNDTSVIRNEIDDGGLSLNAAPEPPKRVTGNSMTLLHKASESLDPDSEGRPPCPPPPLPPFRLAPATAIAGVMIRDWVDGKIRFN